MSTTVTPSAVIPAGTWSIDPAHSKVGFAVKHMGIATVRGEFKEFQGALEIGDSISSAKAHGTVKVQSVDTNEPQRDEHLRSPDFFDAATNPQIAFESTSIAATGDDTFRITGELTLHGITNEITLDAEILGTETDPVSGHERIGLEVVGQISRGEFGMKFNQALGSGNLLVADRVRIELDIAAVSQS